MLSALISQGLQNLGFEDVLIPLLIAFVIFNIATVFYNIFFHPLRHFPGPRLAAGTYLFKLYWDAFQGGRLIQELERQHKKHGPVIRIAPNELHFSDPEAYHTINTTGALFVKEDTFYAAFHNPHTIATECDPLEARKLRRNAEAHLSKRNISALQEHVENSINVLLSKLTQHPGKSQNLYRAYRCLATDLISQFTYGKSFDSLHAQEFHHPLVELVEAALYLHWWSTYFKPVEWVLHDFQRWAIGKFNIRIGGITELIHDVAGQVDACLGGGKTHIASLIPYMKERGLPREKLIGEAVNLVLAGIHTLGNSLTRGTVGVVYTPGVQDALYEELKSVWLDLHDPAPALEMLEKLPYLTGVVKEALRNSHGTIRNMPRVATKDTIIAGYFVPAGTIVGISSLFVHTNPTLFPNPELFNPLRWSAPGAQELSKWIVAYSRGSRMCIGMHLANCELYMTFAHIFRKLRLELEGFDPQDIVMTDKVNVIYNGRQTHVMVEKRDI